MYIAQPPLYKVSSGSGRARKEVYAFNDMERSRVIGEILGTADPSSMEEAVSSGKVMVQRFKGLGEMMPAQLWSTTLDPKTRLLKRLTVEDAASANHMFSTLMSKDVDPRRKLITEEGSTLASLDI